MAKIGLMNWLNVTSQHLWGRVLAVCCIWAVVVDSTLVSWTSGAGGGIGRCFGEPVVVPGGASGSSGLARRHRCSDGANDAVPQGI